MEVTDDLDEAFADGALEGCRLTLRFEDLQPDVEIEVTINGMTLPRQSGADAVDGWKRLGITPHFWMEYPAHPEERTNEGKSLTFEVDCPPLRNGDNTIGVSMVFPNQDADSTATLTNVELDIAYKR